MRNLLLAFSLALSVTLFAEAGKVVLVAGGGNTPPPGKATDIQLNGPFGVDWNHQGEMFIIEIAGHRVMKVDAKGMLTLVAGSGAKGNNGDHGPGVKAAFNGMHSLAVTSNGQVLVADTWNNRVRMVDGRAMVHPFAGTGGKGFSGDGGPAVKAQFGGIYCLALDHGKKNLILTDLDNRRIRLVNLKVGEVSTAAGNGEKGAPKDGSLAVESPLVDPRAAVMDANNNLYILERSGHALRVVDAKGKIRTVMGTGKAGKGGVGGPALQTQMSGPKHLCVDGDGAILIADTENHRVLRYDPLKQTSSLVAGTGKKGNGGVGGPPEEAELFQPHGVHIGPQGKIYITDSSNNRVLRIDE
ncbi:MAG: hypothetical protein EXR99_06640 [Gemmataceae bacterium]|nr:hypothetical protein [Gemmataceae bacterium]